MRSSELVRAPGRDEQPVLAVVDDLGHAADGRGDDGDADRERLDRGVREVLPVAREQRRLGAGDDPQRVVARAGTAELDPAAPRTSPRRAARAGSLGTVADEDEPRLRHPRDSLDRGSERLLAREPADEDERSRLEPLRLELARRGRGVREHVDPVSPKPPASGDLGQVGARDDDRARAPQRARAERLQGAHRPRAGGLELLQRAGEEPVPLRALVGRVGHELHDERPARERRLPLPPPRTSPTRRRRPRAARRERRRSATCP